MDHFTQNIIRDELRALTAFPPPDPSVWAFSEQNNCIFERMKVTKMETATAPGPDLSGIQMEVGEGPLAWVKKGPKEIKKELEKL